MIPLFIFVFSGRGGARREDGFGEGITAIPRILEKKIFHSGCMLTVVTVIEKGFKKKLQNNVVLKCRSYLSTLVTRIVEVLMIAMMI